MDFFALIRVEMKKMMLTKTEDNNPIVSTNVVDFHYSGNSPTLNGLNVGSSDWLIDSGISYLIGIDRSLFQSLEPFIN